MSATAVIDFKFDVTEGLGSLGDLVSGSVAGIHSMTETTSFTLDSGSTPPITQVWSDEFTLSAGAATLDLTALARDAQANLDLTGLKIQAYFFATPSTNTDTVTIVDGATNGYNIFGDASGQITIGASGQKGFAMFYAPETLQDVGASDKTIDLSSSDTDATVKVLLVAG